MQYKLMLLIAAIMALMSAIMTAFGMTDLFKAAGMFILALFFVIDLGRFLLFNFLVNEWNNLRKVKYFICFIIIALFGYSAVGIYSKLSSLVTPETKQAMVNMAVYNKAHANANTKQNRSEDLAKIAEEEYREALEWNKNDLANCIARARGNKNSENKCNNTKRALDIKASNTLKEALAKADASLDNVEETIKADMQNQSEIATVLTTICKFSQKSCNTYSDLQNALTIVIIFVIIGTDYLQIGIVLAVNTRKNKKIKKEEEIEDTSKVEKITKQPDEKSPNDQVKSHQTTKQLNITPRKQRIKVTGHEVILNQPEKEEIREQTTEEKLIDALTEDPNFAKEELADGIITQNEMTQLLDKATKRPGKKVSKQSNDKPYYFSGPHPTV